MNRRVIFSLLALGLLGGMLQAADVSGKWTAKVPTRGGDTRDATFVFKQDGSTLTGTTTGRDGDIQIHDGKVEGDTISFSVTQNFGGNDVKLLYKGTVSGDEIKFTRQREGGEPREFTAKKAGS